jgi:serine/threonine-protein kinase RsbW
MNSGNPLNISLTFAADASAVGAALAAARGFAEAAGLAPNPARRLAIVVEELVANLVDHAGLNADDRIDLALALLAGGVTLVLGDPAAPFDPRTAPLPADMPPADGGGAGLALVRAFAGGIDYRSSGGRNRLEVRIAG